MPRIFAAQAADVRADNSPLFEEATEKEGYFFRQFPLVNEGQLVENEQRGKAVRRAICDRNGEIFTIETLTDESFHDFAQALVDLGVDNATSSAIPPRPKRNGKTSAIW